MRRHCTTPRLLTATLRASLGAVLLGATPPHALAQRGPRAGPPPGAEIAAKAKSARFDHANVGTGEFEGKRIAFTPAVLDADADLAAGQVIGVLENEVAGDETGLPAGRYNVFVAKLADGWHMYAESGGEVVKEALRVRVEERAGQPASTRPRFRAKGWGYDIDYTGGGTITRPPAVASVTITPSSLSVLMGESKQFAIELRDSVGNVLAGRTITWASSATGVATASGTGIVTGVAPGTATFTATSGGKTASATVSVPTPRYAVYLSGWTTTHVGGSLSLSAYVSVSSCRTCPPDNLGEVAWTSSNPAIATVQRGMIDYQSASGRVTGVAEGSATITATYRGAMQSLPVTVKRAPVGRVSVSPAPLTVVVGEPGQLTATVYSPEGLVLGDRAVAWSSNDPAVADVTTTGRVIPLVAGSTTIRAMSEGVGTIVSVQVKPVRVSTVTVTPASTGLSAGTSQQLQATLVDAAGNVLTGRTVVWTTDNAAAVDVTATGRILGVAPGSATITAMSEGKSGTAVASVPGPTTGGPTPTSYVTVSGDW